MGHYRFLVFFAGLFLCTGIAGAQGSPFTETFEVTRTDWYRGENVTFTFTRCNVSEQRQQSNRPCGFPIGVDIFTHEGSHVASQFTPYACAHVIDPIYWAPGQCRRYVMNWPQTEGWFPESEHSEFDPGELGPRVEPGLYYAANRHDDNVPRTVIFQIHDSPPPIPILGGAAMMLLIAMLMMVGSYVLESRRV